jgi:predicted PurR-regulated permease PerM
VGEADPKTGHTDQLTSRLTEFAVRLAIVALLLYWAVALVRPFATIAIWSAILAVTLYPLFDWLATRLGNRRRLAALLITAASLFVVIGPVTWLVLGLVDSARTISEKLDLTAISIPPPPLSIKSWPVIGNDFYQFWNLASHNLADALAKVAPYAKPLAEPILRVGANAGIGVLQFFIAIFVAGFLFAPAPAIGNAIKALASKLSPDQGEKFIDLSVATTRSVSRGVVGISALQALLAGLALIVAQVPGASLISSAVLICGIIQIGPSVVIIPVIIWSWMTMSTTAALLFTAYMIPVNLLDNILKPIVMSHGLMTPTLLILIGVIGGTISHGITGLFLGPIVLAVIWEILIMWVKYR